jgi:hypothetical protein
LRIRGALARDGRLRAVRQKIGQRRAALHEDAHIAFRPGQGQRPRQRLERAAPISQRPEHAGRQRQRLDHRGAPAGRLGFGLERRHETLRGGAPALRQLRLDQAELLPIAQGARTGAASRAAGEQRLGPLRARGKVPAAPIQPGAPCANPRPKVRLVARGSQLTGAIERRAGRGRLADTT